MKALFSTVRFSISSAPASAAGWSTLIRHAASALLLLCLVAPQVQAQCSAFADNLDGTINAPDPAALFSGTFPFCSSLTAYPSPLDPAEQSVAPFSAFCPGNVGIKNRGTDASYQVVVGQDFVIPFRGGAESEGRVTIAGNLDVHRQYGIGESGGGTFLVGAPDVSVSVVGNLTGTGTVTTGSSASAGSAGTYTAVIGGTADFNISGAVMEVGTPPILDTDCLLTQATTVSGAAAALTPTGTFNSGFVGTNADLEVFHVPALPANGILPFTNIKAGATVIINVAGTTVTYGIGVFNGRVSDPWAALNGSDQDAQVYNVVWNFYEATNVTVLPNPAGGIHGLVLVPNGNLNLGTNLNGRVYVGGTLTHSGEGTEIHNYPFIKNLPVIIGVGNCDCSNTLPVEWAAFHAQPVGRHGVQLTWQTASETNNAGFEVETTSVGLNAEAASVGLNTEATSVGLNAEAASVGLNAEAASVGLNAEAASVGLNAEAASVGLNAEAASVGLNAEATSVGARYIVPRLANSSASWQTIGFVEGHGTTTESRRYTYQIDDLGPGRYQFRLKQVDYDGSFTYSPTVTVDVELPGTHYLSNVYPNPFNPQATFSFAVAQAQPVRVALYDVQGRLLRVLFAGVAEAGHLNTVRVNGGDLPSGLYLVHLTGDGFTESRELVLAK